MTYTKSTGDDHPFHHTTVVYFKGGPHSGAVTDPSFAGFSVGDEVHIRDWVEDKDGYYVRLLEDGDPDAPVWNTDWFTDDPAKVYKPTTNVQEDDMNDRTNQPIAQAYPVNLPAYEQGERSRVVEEVKTALVEAREELVSITAAYERRGREIEQVRRAAAEEVRRAAAEETTRLIDSANDEIDRIHAAHADEIDKVKAERDALASELHVAEAERDAAAAALSYAVERLDAADLERVLGYWDGVKDATLPSSEG